jgi:hypothetical protein
VKYEYADVGKFNPQFSFPLIIIGDRLSVGCDEKTIREALGL